MASHQQKRSVSPFGFRVDQEEILPDLTHAFQFHFPLSDEKPPARLKTTDDMRFIPALVRRVWEAPANDAPELSGLCQYLVNIRTVLEEKSLADIVYASMADLFNRKTDIFLIDHLNKEMCEKMGLKDDYRDVVLFSKERDALVGHYFAPVTENNPGKFSEFISHWMGSESPDRVLHFLDFAAGAKNPTFEHYLLFAHPALARPLSNKSSLKHLLERVRPTLSRLSSPTWEKDIVKTLGL